MVNISRFEAVAALLAGAVLLPAPASAVGQDVERAVAGSADRLFDASIAALGRLGYEIERVERARGLIQAVRAAPERREDAGMVRYQDREVVTVRVAQTGADSSRVRIGIVDRSQFVFRGRPHYARVTPVRDQGRYDVVLDALDDGRPIG